MLCRIAFAAHTDLKLHLLEFGGSHPTDQGQVLHFLEATDILPILHNVLSHHSGDPGESHELFFRGRVDVQPLLVHQDVAEVTSRAKLAAVAEV